MDGSGLNAEAITVADSTSGWVVVASTSRSIVSAPVLMLVSEMSPVVDQPV